MNDIPKLDWQDMIIIWVLPQILDNHDERILKLEKTCKKLNRALKILISANEAKPQKTPDFI